MDLNRVMLIGRATDTVEIKIIGSNGSSVVNFVIVTNRRFTNKDGNQQEEAEYHRCVAYGVSADVLGKYLRKGKRIYIEWRLRTRKREDNAWLVKYSTEIIVNHFIFLDSKSADGDNATDAHHITEEHPDTIVSESITDDEVPF